MELFTPGHLIVLAIVVAILFFGWKQLPDMSRSLGRSLRILKTEVKGMTEDDKAREGAAEATAAKPQTAQPRALQPAPVVTPVAPARPAAAPVARQAAPAPRPAAPAASAPRPRPTPRGTSAGAGQSPASR